MLVTRAATWPSCQAVLSLCHPARLQPLLHATPPCCPCQRTVPRHHARGQCERGMQGHDEHPRGGVDAAGKPTHWSLP
uniref:Uncharacterized protein n=1 Tax=Arundo donax TaxID=35708 RepID=A0A0A9AZY9_ARUDO